MSDQGLGEASGQEARPQPGTSGAATPLTASFQLGAIVKPLAEQFSAQSIFANPGSVELWQQRMEAIVTLRFGDVLTWSQAEKAYDRLGKQIWAGLRAAAKRSAKATSPSASIGGS